MTIFSKIATGTADKNDAINLLTEDHKNVKKLFQTFEKIKDEATATQKEALVAEICEELSIHADAEEAIFYPAARTVIQDEELVDEAEVEHAGAKDLIKQLQAMRSDDPKYNAKVTVLSEYIDHHVKEEQDQMFLKVRKMKKLDLEKLGEEIQNFKEKWKTKPASAASVKSKKSAAALYP